jgi:hypothetical protein
MKKTVLLISIFIYQISIACSAFYFNGENKILAKILIGDLDKDI